MPDAKEIGRLAEALNEMAKQLHERIQTTIQQRNLQEAILTSMIEGVIAVDSDERIMSVNNAAGRCLNIVPEAAIGKSMTEVVRNAGLQEFSHKVRLSQSPAEGEIVLDEGKNTKILHGHGAVLRDPSGEAIGSVFVLHDVTRLRRLEAVRRDFVANVSHELKTPITSIKGFVETLRDGAMHDPEDAARFLEIIARQADRLHAIIEDLLSLSRIEQEKEDIVVSRVALSDIIKLAIECCRMKCEEKNITCEWHCNGDLEACVNPPLLEQALVNLIDNAIKYSDDGGRIEITALRDSGHIRIDVKDWGCGIGPGTPDARVRTVLPRGQGSQPQTRRHGPGTGHRQTHQPSPRRTRSRREHTGRGKRFYGLSPMTLSQILREQSTFAELGLSNRTGSYSINP